MILIFAIKVFKSLYSKELSYMSLLRHGFTCKLSTNRHLKERPNTLDILENSV